MDWIILSCYFIITLTTIAVIIWIVGDRLSQQIKENRIILDAIRNYLNEQLKNNHQK